MLEILGLIAGGAAAVGGYLQTRSFVTRRLRYVDGVQKTTVPVIAGTAAAIVAAPVVALLPIIGAPAAILFGLGVGAGTKAGAKDIREGRDRFD
jgi:hypothetical protein